MSNNLQKSEIRVLSAQYILEYTQNANSIILLTYGLWSDLFVIQTLAKPGTTHFCLETPKRVIDK